MKMVGMEDELYHDDNVSDIHVHERKIIGET
jgi:hypothetical protein